MVDRLRLRFWDKEECQYLKPSFFDSIWFDKDGGIHVGCYSDIVGKVVDYTNEVDVEQCTGLKDKNGKLIFEGDILLCERKIVDCVTGAEIYYKSSGVVQREKNGKYFINGKDWYGSDITFYNECAEIIGNIHEQAKQNGQPWL